MEKRNNNGGHEDYNSFTDYIDLLRNNIVPGAILVIICLIAAVIYALNATEIFVSTTSVKLSKPQGSILESPFLPEFQSSGSDKFVENEIEVMKSYTVCEKAAEVLTDSFNQNQNKSVFSLLLEEQNLQEKPGRIKSINSIAGMLGKKVSITQKGDLYLVLITAESPSPYEAALIANVYAHSYRNLNLEINRNQINSVVTFLNSQREGKQEELKLSEEDLREFQEKGGIVALDEQASALIEQLSHYEAQKNVAKLELTASDKVLSQYRDELDKQSPRMAEYLESLSSEGYYKSLQEQLAYLKVQKDLVGTLKSDKIDVIDQIKKYDERIKDIQEKLQDKLDVIKAGIFSSSPEQVKQLTNKILEEEIKNQSLRIRISELNAIVERYDVKFNQLPKSSIEFARLKRNRESLEKLFLLVEEKYQEALINEQSQPSNVLILDKARIPVSPSKPNKAMIIAIGLMIGMGLTFVYVFIVSYLDNTIKTPEDIQMRDVDLLGWIPVINHISNGENESEFIVFTKPDSIPSEAFRSIRTRIHSKIDSDLKCLLITSCAQQEGKTTICVNLAGSFASMEKKTLVIDCDLRKPGIHEIFGKERAPGLTDYLSGKVSLEDIIKPAYIPDLYFIPSGNIPPNPAEMLASKKMNEFIKKIRDNYDIILLDSPPITTVTDTEILANMADGSILVISADNTKIDLMERSVQLVRISSKKFLGAILNKFTYKSGYGSYYKNYYHYPDHTDKKKKSRMEVN